MPTTWACLHARADLAKGQHFAIPHALALPKAFHDSVWWLEWRQQESIEHNGKIHKL